jgi:hypothetical protein
MEDTSEQFNLGTIDSHGGKLIFQLVVEQDGSTYVNIWPLTRTIQQIRELCRRLTLLHINASNRLSRTRIISSEIAGL